MQAVLRGITQENALLKHGRGGSGGGGGHSGRDADAAGGSRMDAVLDQNDRLQQEAASVRPLQRQVRSSMPDASLRPRQKGCTLSPQISDARNLPMGCSA